jgi:hypothetical protein
MQRTRTAYLPILAAALMALAAPAAGCGSSDYSSSKRPETRAQAPTATARAPEAPPGASARSCEGTVEGTEQLRVTGIGCDGGRGVVAAWANEGSCSPENEASRVSCSVPHGYRCLGAATERGVAVSCSRPGSSIAFVAVRG